MKNSISRFQLALVLVAAVSVCCVHGAEPEPASDAETSERSEKDQWVEAYDADAKSELQGQGQVVWEEWQRIMSEYNAAELPEEVYKIFQQRSLKQAESRVKDGLVTSPAGTTGSEIFITVPIHGTIGEDVAADDLEEVFRYANSQNVKYVVFDIDTPGGLLSEAYKINDLLRDNRERFTYVSCIRDAFSAGIVFPFHSKAIYMLEGASMGAATAYSVDSSTGDAQVDAKLNSAWASAMASVGESQGYSPLLGRSMVLMDATLYVWEDAQGELVFSESPPDDESAVSLLLHDTQDQVLTLTTGEAVSIGLAKLWSEEDSQPFAEIAAGGLKPTPVLGHRVMQSVVERRMKKERRAAIVLNNQLEAKQEAREDLIEKIPRLVFYINENIDAANKHNPYRYKYRVDENRYMTGSSLKKWRSRCDNAIAAWERIIKGVEELIEAEEEARELGLEVAPHEIHPKDLINKAERNLAQLRKDRSKRKL